MLRKQTTSWFCILIAVGAWGCSLTATRPIQEMSNATTALRAAKDLHADSLVPEKYRAAESYFAKARRNYILKEFDLARLYALKATRLAEDAEFEAYRLGGDTPEVQQKLVRPEGGAQDADSSLLDGEKPGGPPGPAAPPQPPTPSQEPPFRTEGPSTAGVVPNTGSLPINLRSGPTEHLISTEKPASIFPKKGAENPRLLIEDAEVPETPEISNLYDGAKPIPDLFSNAKPIPDLIPVKQKNTQEPSQQHPQENSNEHPPQ